MPRNHHLEKGNAIPEYAIILGAVAVVATGALAVLGLNARGTLDYATYQVAHTGPTSTPVITDTITTPTPTPTLAPTLAPDPDALPDRSKEDDEADPGGGVGEEDERKREEASVFFDDFEDGDTDGWFPARGDDWRIENGRYCAGRARRGEHRTFAGDPTWTDYTVTVQAELSRGPGWGVYFRATNPSRPNAYIFQYDPGYGGGAFLFRQVVGGRERSPFARVWAPSDFAWRNRVRTASVRVQGDTFTAYLDGQQVLQASHSEFKAGQIGLRKWSSSVVCFDNVTVKPLLDVTQESSRE